MKSIQLESKSFIVSIKSFGAELCSLKSKSSKQEYIWQAGDEWPKHAPNLFPIVGSLLDGEFVYDGKTYGLRHHGLARHLEFEVEAQSKTNVIFKLQSDEESLSVYPFKYELRIGYKLDDNSLVQSFEVLNVDDKEMLFSFGAHPAFAVDDYSKYDLVFEQNEEALALPLEGAFISPPGYEIIEGDRISLNKSSFDKDALVFEGLKSDFVDLRKRDGSHTIRVSIKDWPYLGIWAKAGAAFVCIEPWEGIADFIGHDKKLGNKKGILKIASGKSYKNEFAISVLA